MRNGVINAGSPREDIWGVLTGIWNEYDTGNNKEWHVVTTPFFIHCDAVLKAGRNQLPFKPNRTTALSWTSKDNFGSVVCRVGETGFDIPENAFVEVTMYGNYGGNDAH